MKKTYYIVKANDGSPASKECNTYREARKELKDIIREDVELGLQEGDIEYYIEKCNEKIC